MFILYPISNTQWINRIPLYIFLQEAVQKQNRQIAERIKLNDSKAEVLRKLEEATKLTSFLEAQLKR